MSQRVVIGGSLLTLRAAALHWGEENGPGDAVGTRPIHLRWMIHRALGLPLQPFQVWRAPNPFDTQSKQDLANNAEWQLVEIVGLPVNSDDWADTGYSAAQQGLVDVALLDPIEAAFARLRRGAPPKGWLPFGPDGNSVPLWQRPDESRFLETVVNGEILKGLHEMLVQQPVSALQEKFVLTIDRPDEDLLPRLLLNSVVGTISGDDKPRGSWSPLSVMAMTAGSDPLAALALGFGTAIDSQQFGEEIYMVTVRCTDGVSEIELADVAMGGPLTQQVPKPTGLATRLARVTRPQHLDGIKQDTIAISWQRPPTQLPPTTLKPEIPTAVAYAIARTDRQRILLTPRYLRQAGDPDPTEWLSFVPGKPVDAGSIAFLDHNLRGEINATGEHPAPLEYDATYAVAGQDIFGRWSDWETTSYSAPREKPQGPTVVSVSLDNAGQLTVDFSWDWSDRSPQFVELFGAWTDNPGTTVTSVGITFAGGPVGQIVGGEVVPLNVGRAPCDWGPEQDRVEQEPLPFHWTGITDNEPGTRYYRWTANIDVAFLGKRLREFGVSGRGQQRVHFTYFGGASQFNISPLSVPVIAEVWDDRPLPSPAVVIEAPLWASLPDMLGVSRFTLNWGGVPGVAGYVVYEATETALLSAANRPAPDTTAVHHQRLKTLRDNVNIGGMRHVFRRMNVLQVSGNSYEVVLPRGSKVMHFYAVTSVTENHIEGVFPTNNRGFFAVAAPRIADAPRIGISVAPATNNPQHVDVELEFLYGSSGRVDIYRTTIAEAAEDVGSMGPPLATIGVAGSALYTDTTVLPNWRLQRYRAVAWAVRDDILGLVESRSMPTPQVTVLVPPSASVIIGLAANQPPSTATDCLLVWTTTSSPSPGTRCVVEVRGQADLNQPPLQRVPKDSAGAVPVALLEDMPSPDVGAGKIYVFADGVHRAWVKRPTADATLVVTVKAIDVLGRMTRETIVVAPLPDAPAPVFDPIDWNATPEAMRGSNGKRFYFELGAAPAGGLHNIWGTDVYTDDSPIGVAAVHAGMLTMNGGRVAIEIRPAEQSYHGTTRNGVTSAAYGPWHGSYIFVHI